MFEICHSLVFPSSDKLALSSTLRGGRLAQISRPGIPAHVALCLCLGLGRCQQQSTQEFSAEPFTPMSRPRDDSGVGIAHNAPPFHPAVRPRIGSSCWDKRWTHISAVSWELLLSPLLVCASPVEQSPRQQSLHPGMQNHRRIGYHLPRGMTSFFSPGR